MSKNYTSIDAKYVIEKLGKGIKVLVCDFTAMRVMDCDNMTIGAITSFLTRTDCKWFSVSEVEDEQA